MQYASINDRVKKIKGNNEEINRLVEEYKPFIASCVEKATGRYVRYGEDDELSIGLLAFVEAINSYNMFKGNFLSFSQNVIKRRLIDYYRKEKKHSNIVSINEYYQQDEETEKDLSTEKSLDNYEREKDSENRRLEIADLQKELNEWGISFSELAETSPKHDKTRRMCSDIINYILSRQELIRQIRDKKYLPIAEIEKSLNLPRKKIERMRKYIIAVMIIRTGDYRYISSFVNWG